MFNFTKLPETIRYDLPCWPGFYVLIVPDNENECWNFYLTHKHFAVIHFMFGSAYSNPDQTPEKLVEMAHWNAPDYLPDFVKECCTDEDIEE
jgi:hypothetical protein